MEEKLSFKLLKNFPKGKKIVIYMSNKGLKNLLDDNIPPIGYFVSSTMEEARQMVMEYVNISKIDFENWNTAQVFENSSQNGYITFNGNHFFQ